MAPAQIPVIYYQKPSTENGLFRVVVVRLAWGPHALTPNEYAAHSATHTGAPATYVGRHVPMVAFRPIRLQRLSYFKAFHSYTTSTLLIHVVDNDIEPSIRSFVISPPLLKRPFSRLGAACTCTHRVLGLMCGSILCQDSITLRDTVQTTNYDVHG